MDFNLTIDASLKLFETLGFALLLGQATTGAILFEFSFWIFLVFL